MMIKLSRSLSPRYLNPKVVANLIAKFKASSESVWNVDDLKWALLKTSRQKCAYCECKLGEESKYVEVEHFKHKGKYPDEVVTWDNLLPSCKRCNVSKGIHDVVVEPIVNPYEVDPRTHVGFRLYRLQPITTIGRSTIDALDLNNFDRVVLRRFKVGEILHESIIVALERLDAYKKNSSTRTKNRLVAQVLAVLGECQSSVEYAATAATVVCNDPEFRSIIVELNGAGLWSDEMESLYARALTLALSAT